ncbi:hypothetical protein AK830_g3150 [Neonectria ditissima]|uniref:Uncharacterized protein n=1 Tax=Neonectria ditissima TaxID=78410 RepID=A0A0P7B9I1_9HYPO|nr:hypothetical protein AK830_g3150 [Neonectria ditissima]
MVITTTEDGSRTTYKTTGVTVKKPDEPTAVIDANDDSDQYVLKYFPSSIPKVSPSSSAEENGGGNGGLSTGALAGIIAGSIAFLIIVLVAAYIIIRHLNKVVAAVSTPKRSDASKSRPSMKEFKPTDSEIDAFSVDPLMVPPRPSAPGPESSNPSPYNLASPDYSSNDPTPSGGGTGYQPVSTSAGNSRQTSFDATTSNDDYFNVSLGNARFSQQSAVSAPTVANRRSIDSHGTYTHIRNYSNASDGSDGNGTPGWNQAAVMELEAQPYVPELPHSPSSVAFPREERRRSSGGSTVSGTPRPPLAVQRQRNRSESFGQPGLGVVDEEIYGFYGPANYLVGQTDSHRPGTGNGNNRGRANTGQEEEAGN